MSKGWHLAKAFGVRDAMHPELSCIASAANMACYWLVSARGFFGDADVKACF